MYTVLWILSAIGYLTIATGVKVYYKMSQWDRFAQEEPYIIGLFWPLYGVWRIAKVLGQLVFWPFAFVSNSLEEKIEARQRIKIEEIRTRLIARNADRELREAEQEVEECLKDKYHRVM